MNRRLRALGATLLPAVSLGLAACDGGTTGVPSSGVASIRVAPDAETLDPGGTVALQATAYDASGAELDGHRFFWASSDTTIAVVSQAGLVESRAPGAAQIAASTSGTSGFARISVRSAAAASVTISPASATLTSVSDTVHFQATVRDAGGHELPGSPVEWSSSNSAVATVTSDGISTAVGDGVATITASSGAARGTATLRVEQRVAALTIAPATTSIGAGDTVRFRATATDARGSVVPKPTVAWATSRAAVATISQSGLASGVAPGSATITATAGGKSATAELTVNAAPPPPVAPVASVEVQPASAQLKIGGTVALTATLRDASGKLLTGRAVTWTTSNAGVAQVTAAGLVTAQAHGEATITATAEGARGTAKVRVSNAAASVRAVSGDGQEAKNNQTLPKPLVVRVADSKGAPVAGVEVRWTTNNGSVAPALNATDANGYASTRWTLGGGSKRSDRRASATVEGLSPAVFRAKRD